MLRPRRTKRAFSTAVALMVCAATAHAEPPGALDQARTEFEAGLSLMDQHQYAAAITSFERSLGLHENPRTRYNLALALRSAGRLRDALAMFETVANPVIGADTELRAQAATMVATINTQLARVSFLVTPGAVVRIDGRVAEALTGGEMALDPGHHVFEATVEDRLPARVEADFAEGQHATVTLDASRPRPGRLHVEVAPANASIRIDDDARGHGSFEGSMAPGDHRVEVTATGGLRAVRTVTVRSDRTTRLSLTLHPPHLYERWWLWTGAGVVLTAAVVGIAVGVSQPAPLPDGSWVRAPIR